MDKRLRSNETLNFHFHCKMSIKNNQMIKTNMVFKYSFSKFFFKGKENKVRISFS